MPDGKAWIATLNAARTKASKPAGELKTAIAEVKKQHAAKDATKHNDALGDLNVARTQLKAANEELDKDVSSAEAWIATEKKKMLKDGKYDQVKTLTAQAKTEVASNKKLIEDSKAAPSRI